MGIDNVIELVVKIFTWLNQKWISKIKSKSANKVESRQILKRFNVWLRFSAKSQIFFNIRSSASAKC